MKTNSKTPNRGVLFPWNGEGLGLWTSRMSWKARLLPHPSASGPLLWSKPTSASQRCAHIAPQVLFRRL